MKSAGRVVGILLIMLAVVFSAAAVYICVNCTGREPVYMTELPDPQAVVTECFDGLCGGDYAAAYACLEGYSTLGLENAPEDPYAAAFWKLLRENTTWKLTKPCTVSGTSASCEVCLISPDLSLLTEGLGEDLNARIEAAVDSEREGIYDEAGDYSREFILAVYDETLQARLNRNELPLRTDTVQVDLRYDGSRWLITSGSELLTPLSGGLS